MLENGHRWLIRVFNDDLRISTGNIGYFGQQKWLEDFVQRGALVQSGTCAAVLCPLCDIPHNVAIDPVSFRGYCAENGVVAIKPAEAVEYAVNPVWMIDALRKALDVEKSPPSKTLIEGVLWFLGQSRIDKKLRPIYLVRKTAGSVESLFKNDAGFEPGAVLHASIQTSGASYRGFREIALADVVDDTGKIFKIDMQRLKRIWAGNAHDEEIFQHSTDYTTVRLRGKVYPFTGYGCKIIKYLHEAYLSGQQDVKTSEMMMAVGLEKTRALKQQFSGRKDWLDLIEYGNPRGTCRLKIDS